jgi:gamma-glutamyltranspeptidase/glutathione hydrolase
MEDLAAWKPLVEEPVMTTYKDLEVYKLSCWTQGPVMLQALNILENFDLAAMKYNSSAYIHTVTQAMHLAFADRDFYYGDPYYPPTEPLQGLLSKAYGAARAKCIDPLNNDPAVMPGNPYAFQDNYTGNPFAKLLKNRHPSPEGKNKGTNNRSAVPAHDIRSAGSEKPADTTSLNLYYDRLYRGTTTIEAADSEGWVVSVTPSGGWIPACIAGNTGIGMSQRMQSFVTDSTLNPFNLPEPGKRPRVTLSPTLVLKAGRPFLSFAVQGGDTQDQNQLQFFLNVVEFGMDVQQAAEAANFNTNQLWLSLGGSSTEDRMPHPGELLIRDDLPTETQTILQKMGYTLTKDDRTSGPINAIFIDQKNKVLVGGSSNYGEDYGIGW